MLSLVFKELTELLFPFVKACKHTGKLFSPFSILRIAELIQGHIYADKRMNLISLFLLYFIMDIFRPQLLAIHLLERFNHAQRITCFIAGKVQLIAFLQVHPESGTYTQPPFKTQSSICGHCPLACNKL
jgi:hypothetical protein